MDWYNASTWQQQILLFICFIFLHGTQASIDLQINCNSCCYVEICMVESDISQVLYQVVTYSRVKSKLHRTQNRLNCSTSSWTGERGIHEGLEYFLCQKVSSISCFAWKLSPVGRRHLFVVETGRLLFHFCFHGYSGCESGICQTLCMEESVGVISIVGRERLCSSIRKKSTSLACPRVLASEMHLDNSCENTNQKCGKKQNCVRFISLPNVFLPKTH